MVNFSLVLKRHGISNLLNVKKVILTQVRKTERFSNPIFKLEMKYFTCFRNLWIFKIIEYQNYNFDTKLNEIKLFYLNSSK